MNLENLEQEIYEPYEELEEEEEGSSEPFRSVSTLAILSLVLGLFSILTAYHWLVVAAPLAGIVLGYLALKEIAKRPDVLIGRGIAWGGIAASLVLWIVGYGIQIDLYFADIPPGYELITLEMLHPEPGMPIPDEIKALEGERVFVRGFMNPGRRQIGLTNFILCPQKGHCPYCTPDPEPTQMVFVELKDGIKTGYSTRLRRVGGEFHITVKSKDKLTTEDKNRARKSGGLPYYIEADYLR